MTRNQELPLTRLVFLHQNAKTSERHQPSCLFLSWIRGRGGDDEETRVEQMKQEKFNSSLSVRTMIIEDFFNDQRHPNIRGKR